MRRTTSSHTRRPLLPPALVAAAGLALAGCAAESPGEDTGAGEDSFPLTVDDCAEEVTFDAPPESVFTIGLDSLVFLDAVGVSDRIVARSGEFGAELPAEVQDPPTDAEIVDPSDPTTEQIIGSEADIVIGSGFFNADVTALEESGIYTLTAAGSCGHDGTGELGAVDFETIIEDVERFGAVFDTAETADAAAQDYRQRIAALEDQAPGETRTAAPVYFFSPGADMSAHGGYSVLTESMRLAGLENIYEGEQDIYIQASVESLLDADPEVIVLSYGLYGETFDDAVAQLTDQPGVSDLQAVTENRIIGIAADETAASPAAVAGAEHLVEEAARLGD